MPDIPTTPGPAGSLPESLRTSVHNIVSDAVRWRLAKADWPGVEALVDDLYKALRSGDPHAVEAALVELELAAPLRIRPIGGPSTDPPPARLRRVAEHIVHDLGAGLDLNGPEDESDQDRSGADHDAPG